MVMFPYRTSATVLAIGLTFTTVLVPIVSASTPTPEVEAQHPYMSEAHESVLKVKDANDTVADPSATAGLENGVITNLAIADDTLIAETSFGEIRVSNPEGVHLEQVNSQYSSNGQVVLEQSDEYVAGYQILQPGEHKAEWNFDLPENVSLGQGEDGAIDLVYTDPYEGTMRVQSFIEPPTAVSVDGDLQDTSYRIEGDNLLQITENGASEVVADPKLTFGRNIYLNLWGYEAEGAGRMLATLGFGAQIALCTVDDKIPGIYGRAAKALCYAVPGMTFGHFKRIITAPSRFDFRSCYQIPLVNSPQRRWVKVDKKNCSQPSAYR